MLFFSTVPFEVLPDFHVPFLVLQNAANKGFWPDVVPERASNGLPNGVLTLLSTGHHNEVHSVFSFLLSSWMGQIW